MSTSRFTKSHSAVSRSIATSSSNASASWGVYSNRPVRGSLAEPCGVLSPQVRTMLSGAPGGTGLDLRRSVHGAALSHTACSG